MDFREPHVELLRWLTSKADFLSACSKYFQNSPKIFHAIDGNSRSSLLANAWTRFPVFNMMLCFAE